MGISYRRRHSSGGYSFTFDNMSLECTTSDENDYQPPEEWIRSDILTNQLGYFTGMNKKATLLSDSASSVKFDLKDKSGNVVFSDKSEPKGLDMDSGDNVHELDFSDYEKDGVYYLEAENGSKSREFEIGNGKRIRVCFMIRLIILSEQKRY